MRRYFRAYAVRLTSGSAAPRSARRIRPGQFQSRRQRVRTPEVGPLACRRGRACSTPGPWCPPAPQAPRSSPREADGLQLASSWTRDACILIQLREAGISLPSAATPSPSWPDLSRPSHEMPSPRRRSLHALSDKGRAGRLLTCQVSFRRGTDRRTAKPASANLRTATGKAQFPTRIRAVPTSALVSGWRQSTRRDRGP